MKNNISREIEALGAILAAVEGIEQDKQTWIFSSAMARLGLKNEPSTPSARAHDGQVSAAVLDPTKAPTPKEFMKLKNPRTDVQRALCLGHYLSQHRGKPHFKTKDLKELNTEAAGVQFSNLSVAVSNATSQSKYFVPAGSGSKQVTSRGEEVVNALPDQAAVKALDANKPKKRKTRKTRREQPKAR